MLTDSYCIQAIKYVLLRKNNRRARMTLYNICFLFLFQRINSKYSVF